MREYDLLVAAFVDLLVEVLEASPAVKIIPGIVEAFDLGFGRVWCAESRYRLYLAEARLSFEHRPEQLEELLLRILRVNFLAEEAWSYAGSYLQQRAH